MSEIKPVVRIGFVGVGNMGQMAHLRNYASLPECKVVALAEPRPELARRVAAKYEVPSVYPDAAAMLAGEQLDALVAPQPFDRHGQLVAPLYQSGLPVLTEKPLASSPETGRKMLEALKAGGSWHMVGYHKRSDPAVVYAKAEIERLKSTGELGSLRYVRIQMAGGDWIAGGFNELITSDEPVPPLAADPIPTGMTPDEGQKYVGFVNFYIHQVNLLRYLLGESYRVTHAEPAGILFGAHSASGVPGVIEMGPFSTSRSWQEYALVCFERGWIQIDLPAPVSLNRPGKVTVFRDGPTDPDPQTLVPDLPWEHAMRGQARNFIRAVRGEIPPMCGAEEALEDLDVALDYMRLLKESRS